jgi:tRNA pseudouridine38-40 synthase
MPRYKLAIEYDGAFFCGFQRQINGMTVQQLIEDSLFKLTGEKTTTHAAGRTDAGVHAKGQVVHTDLLKILAPEKLLIALNHFMFTKGACVTKVEVVDVFFHARFQAKKRYYQYKILNRPSPSPLLNKKVWHISSPLNIDAMKKGCSYFLGQHDFSAFRYAKCQSKNTIKTMEQCALSVSEDGMIHIDLASKSFLHNQVRIIVGTLMGVGKNKYPPEYIQELLSQKDRSRSGITAPPYGLYFMNVDY